MSRLSVVIPARGEPFLLPTVQDLLKNAAGDIEVIVVLEGWWPDPPLPHDDKRLRVIHHGKAKGMREAINAGLRIATGEYLMKIDAHCLVGPGFDEILKADCDGDWLVVPRRYGLDPYAWTTNNAETRKAPIDAHFLSYPYVAGRSGGGLHGTVWTERAKARLDHLVDDEMSSQGSCWFATRKHWERIGPMEIAKYGNFIQEFQELGCKTWLGGGRVVVNKKTFYAHLHKGKTHGRGYWISKKEMGDGAKFAVDYWMNDRWAERVRDMRELVARFWPVPTWPVASDGSLDWDEVERKTAEFTKIYQSGKHDFSPMGFEM